MSIDNVNTLISGEKKQPATSSIVSVHNYLSQSWIHSHRYAVGRKNVPWGAELNKQAYEALNLQQRYKGYTKDSKNDIELCNWLDDFSTVEAHLYDFEIPVSFVIPEDYFHRSKPWHWQMLLWTMDPYASKPNRVFTNPNFVTRGYTEKDDKYAPKSFYITDLELGWVGCDRFEDCTFVHHIQMRGALKPYTTINDGLWFYRYMIRRFVQLLPQEELKNLFVLDASTMSAFTEKVTGRTAITTPYGRHVLKKSDFHRVDWNTFVQACPVAASSCKLLEYLKPEEIKLWRYDYDDPHALAK